MMRRFGLSVLCVWLTLLAVNMAQESKPPAKPAEMKADAATGSLIEAIVDAELADRKRQDQAIAWLRVPSEVQFVEAPLADVATFLSD